MQCEPIALPSFIIDVDTMMGRRGPNGGVPHFDILQEVILDEAGTRALTVDSMGDVRLWPRFDPAFEPQRVPVIEPMALAIAARGEGSLVAIVDDGGALLLFAFDDAGLLGEGGATVKVTRPGAFRAVAAMTGGRRVVVGHEGALFLLDDAGARLAGLSLSPGHVLTGLRARGVTVLVVTSCQGLEHVQLLGTDDDRLAWRGPCFALTMPRAARAALPELSPDLRHVAYLSSDNSATVITTDTGALRPFAGVQRGNALGFASAKVVWLSVNQELLVAPIGGVWTRRPGQGACWKTSAGGRLVVPSVAGLRFLEEDGRECMLGYLSEAEFLSFSPDGRTAAWVARWGEKCMTTRIVVREVDTGEECYLCPSHPSPLSFVTVIDRDHLVASFEDGRLALFEVPSGAERQAIDAHAERAYFVLAAQALVLVTSRGCVDIVPLDMAAPEPLGAPLSTPHSKGYFWQVIPLDPARSDGDLAAFWAPGDVPVRVALVRDGGATCSLRVSQGVWVDEPGASARDAEGRQYNLQNPSNIVLLEQGREVRCFSLDQGNALVLRGSPGLDMMAALSYEPPAPRFRNDMQTRRHVHLISTSGMSSGQFATVVTMDGRALWRAVSSDLFRLVHFSSDGSRVFVPGTRGTLVVDTMTGHAAMISVCNFDWHQQLYSEGRANRRTNALHDYFERPYYG